MRALIAALEALRHPKTGVFRSQLMLCPATSWQKSGALILSEAKDPCITNQLHRSFAAWRPLRMTASRREARNVTRRMRFAKARDRPKRCGEERGAANLRRFLIYLL